jgi:hypothetical protein
LKPITYDASMLEQEHKLKPPLNFIDNELQFEMKAMLKSRQDKCDDMNGNIK